MLNKELEEALNEIFRESYERNHEFITLEHLLLALLDNRAAGDILRACGADIDMLRADARVKPDRVLIDHVEEHTIKLALDGGYWCGMTLYPTTKCTPARATDMIERFGTDRIMVNSAGDWGVSDPTAVPKFIVEMRSRGHDESTIRKIVYDNPRTFFSKSKRFDFRPRT